jgi:integrase
VNATPSASSLDIIRFILDGGGEDYMPRQRWQDPKIQTRTDVSRRFYFIRPFVPVVTPEGVLRKQKAIPLGFCDEMGKRQAEARKQEAMATVNAGRFIVECQIPFGELARRYLEARLPQLGAATRAKYRSHIQKHILPAFQGLRVCDLDPATVQGWLNQKEQGGLSWHTRTDLKNILSAIFTQAEEWRLWQGENPCARVKVGRKREVREKRLLSPDSFRSLLAVLPDLARFIVLVIFTTGLRISEVLGLRWDDIDFDRGTLRVARRWHRGDLDQPKSEKARRVRQLGELLEQFRGRYPGPQAAERYIFGGQDGNPPDDRDLNQHFLRPAARRLGIYWKGFGWHTFRRQNISWRQEAGATPFEAMTAAGHAKPETTWLYTITDPQREREQVDRMLGRLLESGPNQHVTSTGRIN